MKYPRFLSSDCKDKDNEIYVFDKISTLLLLILKVKILKNIGSSDALRLSYLIIILIMIHYYFIMDIIFIEFGRNYDIIFY